MKQRKLKRDVLLTMMLVGSCWVSVGWAQERPALLPATCETALALSAAPAHLRDEATVYALGQDGYEHVREGTNGFTCIVNRDHPRVLKLTCFDAEGSATIVPKILQVGAWLREGQSPEQINAALTQGFSEGTFRSPSRPGVAYMLSHYNRPYNPQTDALGWFPPHVMFYAPDLTNEDIGASWEALKAQPALPFIGYQGPQGFMIVHLEEQSRPADHPMPDCPAWVSADPPTPARQ